MAASGNVTCEWVDIGDGLRAYYGKPAGEGPFPAVVIYIEAFGVNDHFEKLTARFAEAGFVAITPDIYDSKIYAYDDLDNAIGHLKRMDDDTVIAQTAATVDFLEKRSEVKSGDICVTGFCMGGRYTFLANAALASRFKAAASFYGGGIGPVEDFAGRKILLDRVGEMQAPIMLWYGSQDQSIPAEEHGRIAEAITAANKRYTMTVFPDVGHGFFCEDRASYDAAATEEAWNSTLAFFSANVSR
jgi:carboxymethylenebutenolidase